MNYPSEEVHNIGSMDPAPIIAEVCPKALCYYLRPLVTNCLLEGIFMLIKQMSQSGRMYMKDDRIRINCNNTKSRIFFLIVFRDRS
jgi:hypothetical protein